MRCPHCAVINLEGFITFPHCAGCGVLLPPLPPVEKKAWRRPLRTALWTSLVGGLATFAAMMATRAIDTRAQNKSRVILSARRARAATVGRHLSLLLTLDTPNRQMTGEASLRALKIRVPREFFGNFRLISLQPQPDYIEKRGGGLYFAYREVPSGTQPHLLLMPLRAGNFDLEIKLFSDNQFQNEYRIALDVAASDVAALAIVPRAPKLQSRQPQVVNR